MSMNVFENPFYILGASTRDNRRKISALAEDKAFLSDPETVNEARNALLIPQKRLEAELRWFLGVNEEKLESILKFLRDFQEGNLSGSVDLSGVKSIALLNVAVYMFYSRRFRDNSEAVRSISTIDGCFDKLEIENIYDVINEDREAASFPIAEETDIENEFQNYRHDVVNVITEKLAELPQHEYVNLAKQLSDDYTGNEIICGDILDDYALRVSSKLEEQKQEIIFTASNIQTHPYGASEHEFEAFFSHIKQWGQMISPSISVAKKRGVRQVPYFDDAGEIVMVVRQLALDLHNKWKKTENSLQIILTLKENIAIFSKDFSDVLNEDIRILNKIIQEKKAREEQEALKRKIGLIVLVILGIFFLNSYSSNNRKSTNIKKSSNSPTYSQTRQQSRPEQNPQPQTQPDVVDFDAIIRENEKWEEEAIREFVKREGISASTLSSGSIFIIRSYGRQFKAISGNGAALFREPRANSTRILDIANGIKVIAEADFTGNSGEDWYYVHLHDGQKGWVHAKFIVDSDPNEDDTVTLTDSEYKQMLKNYPDFAKADKALNDAFAMAKKSLKAKDFEALKKEQEKWISSGRDAEARELIEGGLYEYSRPEAYTETTQARANYLLHLAKGERFMIGSLKGTRINVRSKPINGKVLFQVNKDTEKKIDSLIVDEVPITKGGEKWYRVRYHGTAAAYTCDNFLYYKTNGFISGRFIQLEPLSWWTWASMDDSPYPTQSLQKTSQQRRSELDSQLQTIKLDIDNTKKKLDEMETKLKAMTGNINSYKISYEVWHKESDRKRHNDEVKKYNALLKKYKSLVEKGKNDVARYNSMVDEYNSLRR